MESWANMRYSSVATSGDRSRQPIQAGIEADQTNPGLGLGRCSCTRAVPCAVRAGNHPPRGDAFHLGCHQGCGFFPDGFPADASQCGGEKVIYSNSGGTTKRAHTETPRAGTVPPTCKRGGTNPNTALSWRRCVEFSHSFGL
ncbi:hypothetical protein HJG60_010372 [Phyllostomus discolor]|uniref:Uncharacterized protein n=1 Tax=Phyllostomus discolor TaxID=89673 RepID=A0A834B1T0_9CHIR|nr:hypothetical protein HJG60_010372 [Phyllostomus discolor]